MFKKHALEMKVVKAPKPETSSTVTSHIHVTPENIKEYVKTATFAVVTVYVAKVLVDTASQVAINIAPKR